MNPAIWIAIYMPLFVLFFVIQPSQRRNRALMMKKRKKKGSMVMSNEFLKRYVGKVCNISLGAYGTNYSKARILELVDNWMRIEVKSGETLINTEYIQSIRVLE